MFDSVEPCHDCRRWNAIRLALGHPFCFVRNNRRLTTNYRRRTTRRSSCIPRGNEKVASGIRGFPRRGFLGRHEESRGNVEEEHGNVRKHGKEGGRTIQNESHFVLDIARVPCTVRDWYCLAVQGQKQGRIRASRRHSTSHYGGRLFKSIILALSDAGFLQNVPLPVCDQPHITPANARQVSSPAPLLCRVVPPSGACRVRPIDPR